MIHRQIDVVWLKITRQFHLVFKKEYQGRIKRRFLDCFAEKVSLVVPEVSQEDIRIIATAMLAELRSVESAVRESIIEETWNDLDSEIGCGIEIF